jgi:hypothetical protein
MAIKLKRDQLVKNLSKKYKLATHLDKAIGKGEMEWKAEFREKKGDTGWHPSGDCLPSPYELYHQARSEERELLAPGTYKTFAVGHFWHQYIQHIVVERLGFCGWDAIERHGDKGWTKELEDLIPEAGVTFEGDRYKPFHWVSGSADIAPCEIPGHGTYLVDIKTMGSHDFRQAGLPTWCAAKYEAQVNIYMDFFDLEQAIILCVSKDSPHEFKEYIFERNPPLIEALYAKWKLVSACLDEEVEPDLTYIPALPIQGPK